jgi:hypothetical protein
MTDRLPCVIAGILLLYGCGEAVYGKSEQSWNGWIGSTKDERVRDQGIPTRCHAFKSGGEACEWPIIWGPSLSGTLTITFDGQGRACQWIYKDVYTDRRSLQQCS